MVDDCPRCGELEALKENYRLAEAIARGEESRARELESNLNMAGGEIQCCHRRIAELEAALGQYGRHASHCSYGNCPKFSQYLHSKHGGCGKCRCTCGLDTLRGTPDG